MYPTNVSVLLGRRVALALAIVGSLGGRVPPSMQRLYAYIPNCSRSPCYVIQSVSWNSFGTCMSRLAQCRSCSGHEEITIWAPQREQLRWRLRRPADHDTGRDGIESGVLFTFHHHPNGEGSMGQVQSAFDPDSQVPVVYDNPRFPSLYNPTFDSTVEGSGYFLHDAYGKWAWRPVICLYLPVDSVTFLKGPRRCCVTHMAGRDGAASK